MSAHEILAEYLVHNVLGTVTEYIEFKLPFEQELLRFTERVYRGLGNIHLWSGCVNRLCVAKCPECHLWSLWFGKVKTRFDRCIICRSDEN